MRLLDDLANSFCKTTSDGRRLYYPWGWGKGYIVSPEDKFTALRGKVKRCLAVMFLLCFLGGVGSEIVVTWLADTMALPIPLTANTRFALRLIVFALLAMAPYFLWLHALRRHLPRAEERRTFSEALAIWTGKTSLRSLWILQFCSVAGLAFGIYSFVVKPADWLPGIAVIGVCSFVSIITSRRIFSKRRQGTW